jgi:hypothetical protein
LDWENIREEVAAKLTTDYSEFNFYVCENNRTGQVAVDAALWGATLASLGTAGIAAAGIKGAAIVGTKAAITEFAKKGAFKAAGRTFKSKLLTTKAKELGLIKKNLGGAAVNTFMKGEKAAAASSALKGLTARFAISTTVGVGFGAAALSWLNSDFNGGSLDTCSDLDTGHKCYITCDETQRLFAPDDDMNTKVFLPNLGVNLCVDEDSYGFRRVSPQGQVGEYYYVKNEQTINKIKEDLTSKVADQGGCDWSSDDIDFYIGSKIFDPKTLEKSVVSADGKPVSVIVPPGLRLDD